MTAFAVILAELMFLILDFDMPVKGFVRLNYESFAQLIQQMEADLP